jgi:hypothetical protein
MDIRGININNVNNVNMMSNNPQVKYNANNTNANNTKENIDSVVDNSSVSNIKITKKKYPLNEFITVEEIRDGKKYWSYVDVEPYRSRVSINIFGTGEGGKSVLLGSYEIRGGVIMDKLHGLKSTLPREVIFY